MSPAAIAVQLVSYENDKQHKGYIKVILHVPEEGGNALKEMFPWPSYSNPVPVTLAPMNWKEGDAVESPQIGQHNVSHTNLATEKAAGQERDVPAPASRLTRQAAICCRDQRFRTFLQCNGMPATTPEQAAIAVKLICHVESRKEFIAGTSAGDRWEQLYGKFIAWRDHDVGSAA